MTVPAPLDVDGVAFVRDRRPILRDVSWRVHAGERWAVIGPNGAGKSTLLRIAATYELPTRGRVEVLGHRVGASDLRQVRRHIGVVAPWLATRVASRMSARDAVLTGVDATLRRFRQEYTPAQRRRAEELLDLVGCVARASEPFARLSDGERQRVLLARALASEPALLILDEPAANLDLPGRELLVATLGRLAEDPAAPAMIVVTHHLEEIPPGCGHVLLLRGGRVVAAGPIDATLTDETASACFGLPLTLERAEGRLRARLRAPTL